MPNINLRTITRTGVMLLLLGGVVYVSSRLLSRVTGVTDRVFIG
jgi:hypothetical protein